MLVCPAEQSKENLDQDAVPGFLLIQDSKDQEMFCTCSSHEKWTQWTFTHGFAFYTYKNTLCFRYGISLGGLMIKRKPHHNMKCASWEGRLPCRGLCYLSASLYDTSGGPCRNSAPATKRLPYLLCFGCHPIIIIYSCCNLYIYIFPVRYWLAWAGRLGGDFSPFGYTPSLQTRRPWLNTLLWRLDTL